MYTFLSNTPNQFGLFWSLIIHTSVSILGFEEMVHAEQPWLWISFQRLCLFIYRLCSRLTMWWLTRSTVMRRWGWLPRLLHPTWTETPRTAPTETWTWKTSPGFAWSSFRRTPMSPWWVDANINYIQISTEFPMCWLKKKIKNRPNCVLSVSLSSDCLF